MWTGLLPPLHALSPAPIGALVRTLNDPLTLSNSIDAPHSGTHSDEVLKTAGTPPHSAEGGSKSGSGSGDWSDGLMPNDSEDREEKDEKQEKELNLNISQSQSQSQSGSTGNDGTPAGLRGKGIDETSEVEDVDSQINHGDEIASSAGESVAPVAPSPSAP